eukprot:765765-Hanusia_phi.AAC.3
MPPAQLDEEEEGGGKAEGKVWMANETSERQAASKQEMDPSLQDNQAASMFLKGEPHLVFVHNMLSDSSLTVR